MKWFLVLIGVALIIATAGAIPDLSDYAKITSLNINITESMGTQTDYQIKFILSNASGISGYYAPDNVIFTNGTTRPNWYDINVTDSADTPLSFWVENNTATAYNITAWVRSQSITIDNASGMKWRYGNSSQTESTMDGLNTFLDWDDFIDGTTINTTKWIVGGSPTQSSGILTLNGAGTSTLVSSKTNFSTNVSLVTYTKLTNTASKINQIGLRNTTADDWAYVTWHTVDGFGSAFTNGGASTNRYGYSIPIIYNIYSIKRTALTTYAISINGTPYTVPSSNAPDALLGMYFRDVNGARVDVDWGFVRKSVLTEPITSSYVTSEIAVVPPIANFTCTPTTAMLGESIACTDTSSDTPTNWTYYWGDGNVTDGTQNPSYTYPFTGTFSINQTVNNTLGSSWYNRSNYITITNVSGFTQQDLWQTGHYTKTLHITDSATTAPIPVVVVTDSNGQSYTTTNGTAFFTEDAGAVVFYFAATGYVSKSMSYIIDGDSTDTVQMVASEATPQQNTWYTPWQVRIRILDYYGTPLPNINVSANYVASTLPSTDTSWLVTAYGISSAVATDMVNSAKAMEGTTDDNGGLSFTMFKSLQYRLTITNTTLSVASTKTLYPSDQEYVIYVRTAGQGVANNTLAMRNGTLPWYSVNSTHINLNMTYVDTSLCTSDLTFRVWFRDNGTEVHNTTWSGFGAGYVYDNHTVPKAPIGTEYLWGYNATTVC